jgi:hypothetical protein
MGTDTPKTEEIQVDETKEDDVRFRSAMSASGPKRARLCCGRICVTHVGLRIPLPALTTDQTSLNPMIVV